ncbi:hypothetical protein AAFF_G00395410, partial [Aldrovandia affinis]
GDLPRVTINPQVSFEAVRKQVSELKERLEDICKGELVKISQTAALRASALTITPPAALWVGFERMKEVHILEPRTSEFLQYSCQLKLDPNTVHRLLHLSEGNREVTRVGQIQPYPDHPERFDSWGQVLCREGLSGRCYWEAEWRGRVRIAVSYKEISRKGGGLDCGLGCNDKSWSLECCPSRFWHNNKSTKLPAPPSSTVGVYLDHKAGTMSFYSISDTMTLLHRVQTTFTQPLYPGLWVNSDSSVKLCDLG